METSTPADETTYREKVLEAERHGDYLAAYDHAQTALAAHPDSRWLAHRLVLALARAGATGQARARFVELGLDRQDDEDLCALAARLDKDDALWAPPATRPGLLRMAAERYAAIHAATGGAYPAVNAATLYRLAGDRARSTELATAVLDGLRDAQARGEPDNYYHAVTEAEAAVLLGDLALARSALVRASALHGGDRAALGTTYRQLKTLCAHAGIDPELLAAIRPAPVIHYAGHRIGPRFPAEAESSVAQAIVTELDALRVGTGFGSLAAGADVLFAEALLGRGAELHVVLPFAEEDFRATSVSPCGRQWDERFQRCLRAASSVTFAADDRSDDDVRPFAHCTQLAMGLAVLRARMLGAACQQVAVWDGGATSGVAGTASDVAAWRALGRPSTIIPVVAGSSDDVSVHAGTPAPSPVRGLLFGDVRGFSKLRERQIPSFVDGVLGALAIALAPFERNLLSSNTWGDGIYLVLRDPVSAAGAALALQRAMLALDTSALGLPANLGLRIGVHAGPVVDVFDPLTRRPSQFGTHVTRTARIEPVTPVGEVYATEDFAAYLALASEELRCEYVGRMPSAKGFGVMRMYVLKLGAKGA